MLDERRGLIPAELVAAIGSNLFGGDKPCRSPTRNRMSESLEIRITSDRGRGLFTRRPFAAGERVLEMKGWLASSTELDDDWLAMQVGPDLWLCSHGDLDDDCGNHSCNPNAGFTTGEPVLHALRDIPVGDEICWDYSTSIAEAGWSLECRCGTPTCRRIVHSWPELTAAERDRLRGIALAYLRDFL